VGYTGRHTVNRPREDRDDAGSLHESNAMTIDHNIEAVRQACTRLARPGSCQLVQQDPPLRGPIRKPLRGCECRHGVRPLLDGL
jgi:hypothetical protein